MLSELGQKTAKVILFDRRSLNPRITFKTSCAHNICEIEGAVNVLSLHPNIMGGYNEIVMLDNIETMVRMEGDK